MSLSIFNSDPFQFCRELPRSTKGWHVLLVALCVCVVVAGKLLVAVYAPTSRTLAVQALDEETEVIVTGSSRVERGVDPLQYDVDMVNLSSGGLSYETMDVVVRRALERAPNVKLVVIEADIFMVRCDGISLHWGSGILDEFGVSLWDLPVSPKVKVRRFLTQSPVFFANRLTPMLFLHPFSSYSDIPKPDLDGFKPFDFPRDLATDPDVEHHGPVQFVEWHSKWLAVDHSDRNVPALLRLCRELGRRNIRVALLMLPHLDEWTAGIPDLWRQQMDDLVIAVSDELGDDAIIWDFSNETGFGLEMFHDGLHLNKEGVAKMAALLGPRIHELLIEDKGERRFE